MLSRLLNCSDILLCNRSNCLEVSLAHKIEAYKVSTHARARRAHGEILADIARVNTAGG